MLLTFGEITLKLLRQSTANIRSKIFLGSIVCLRCSVAEIATRNIVGQERIVLNKTFVTNLIVFLLKRKRSTCVFHFPYNLR